MPSPDPAATLRALVEKHRAELNRIVRIRIDEKTPYTVPALTMARALDEIEAALSTAPARETPKGGQTLCKNCFAPINENGFALDGGQSVADRLEAVIRKDKAPPKAPPNTIIKKGIG